MPDRNKICRPRWVPMPQQLISDFDITESRESEELSLDGHALFVPASSGSDGEQHRMGVATLCGQAVGLSF